MSDWVKALLFVVLAVLTAPWVVAGIILYLEFVVEVLGAI